MPFLREKTTRLLLALSGTILKASYPVISTIHPPKTAVYTLAKSSNLSLRSFNEERQKAQQHMGKLHLMVQDFINHYRPVRTSELGWFASQRSLKDVVALAVVTELPQAKQDTEDVKPLSSSLRRLLTGLKKESLVSCLDFSQLLAVIRKEYPPGSPSYTYETALRLGWFLGLHPRKVYLVGHSLTGVRVLGIKAEPWEELPPGEFPSELQELSPEEIADFLWVYRGTWE